jgi:hypothetical protein
MKAYQFRTALTAEEAVAIAVGVRTHSVNDAKSEKAVLRRMYDGLVNEFEIAVNSPEKSVLDIVLTPIMGVSDAQASRESIARWFFQQSEPDFAKRICPNNQILGLFKSELDELIALIPKDSLPDKYRDTKTSDTQKSATTIKAVHGNRVRYQSNREEIYQFALFTLHKYPDQCTTIPKWVTLINEKALLKWPDTGEPPAANSTIEDYLRGALKEPE